MIVNDTTSQFCTQSKHLLLKHSEVKQLHEYDNENIETMMERTTVLIGASLNSWTSSRLWVWQPAIDKLEQLEPRDSVENMGKHHRTTSLEIITFGYLFGTFCKEKSEEQPILSRKTAEGKGNFRAAMAGDLWGLRGYTFWAITPKAILKRDVSLPPETYRDAVVGVDSWWHLG